MLPEMIFNLEKSLTRMKIFIINLHDHLFNEVPMKARPNAFQSRSESPICRVIQNIFY